MMPDPDWLLDKKTVLEWKVFLGLKFRESPVSDKPMCYADFKTFIEREFFVNSGGELEKYR